MVVASGDVGRERESRKKDTRDAPSPGTISPLMSEVVRGARSRGPFLADFEAQGSHTGICPDERCGAVPACTSGDSPLSG